MLKQVNWIASTAWVVYERVNPFMDAWQAAQWVRHLVG